MARLAVTLLVLSLLTQTANGQQRQDAAEAYSEGAKAYDDGDFSRAARLFELADRHEPSVIALRSAIRAHYAAGDGLRALTLSLDLAERAGPEDKESQTLVKKVERRFSDNYGLYIISCSRDCEVTIDGKPSPTTSGKQHKIYAVGGRHVLVASAGSERKRRNVKLRGGHKTPVSFVLDEEAKPEKRGNETVRRKGSRSQAPKVVAKESSPTTNTKVGRNLLIGGGIVAAASVGAFLAHRSKTNAEENGESSDAGRIRNILLGTAVTAAVGTIVFTVITSRRDTSSKGAKTSGLEVTVGSDSLIIGYRGRL